nr:hypothetical protein FFPRI1PSEUD_45170 [Pseudomonas sp. FFPRI_1]
MADRSGWKACSAMDTRLSDAACGPWHQRGGPAAIAPVPEAGRRARESASSRIQPLPILYLEALRKRPWRLSERPGKYLLIMNESEPMLLKQMTRMAALVALLSSLSGCWMFFPPGGGHGGGHGGYEGGERGGPGGGPGGGDRR